ncbi:MAG: hypothetical protein J6C93_02015 [Clostridia bacterium]|nr:hypothetical protein [Clostridia bacterium]
MKMKTKRNLLRALLVGTVASVFGGMFVLAGCGENYGDFGKQITLDADDAKQTYAYYSLVNETVVVDYKDFISEEDKKHVTDDMEQWFKKSSVVYNSCAAELSIDGNKVSVTAKKPGSVKYALQLIHTTENNVNTFYDTSATFTFGVEQAVSTVEEFQSMRDPYVCYVLQNDIDLSGVEWSPYTLRGHLDGNGFTVKNLDYAAKAGDNCVGLFSEIDGCVENVTLQNCNVSVRGNSEYVGLLAGKCKGLLKDVSLSGEVNAGDSDFVGGVVGCQYGIARGVQADVAVEGCRGVGGIFGDVVTDQFVRQYDIKNLGSVKGYEWVGGISGGMTDVYRTEATRATLSSVVNQGAVEGSYYVGGIVGYAVPVQIYHSNTAGKGSDNSYTAKMDVSIEDATNEGAVKGIDYVGGIAGKIGDSGVSVKGVSGVMKNLGNVEGTYYVGGYFGYATGFTVSRLENSVSVIGKGYVGGIGGFTDILENCSNEGTISAQGTYYDGNSYLGGIAGNANKITSCSNSGVIATENDGGLVGGIVGYMQDGTLTSCKNTGSIDCVNASKVGGIAGKTKNVTANANENTGEIFGNNQVGGVYGVSSGTYTNDKNNANINGKGNNVGGVIGWVVGGTYTGAVNEGGTVEGNDSVGGLIGFVEASGSSHKYESLSSKATVVGNYRVGGVFGSSGISATIDGLQCSAPSVTGEQCVGGVLGSGGNITLSNSLIINTVVTGEKYVGGIAGVAFAVKSGTFRGQLQIVAPESKQSVYVGGIAGQLVYAENCINYADVAVQRGDCVGGIVGYLTTTVSGTDYMTFSCTNKGNVTAASHVGGVAGCADKAFFKNCTNEGDIAGAGNCAGIAGYVDLFRSTESCKNEGNVTAQMYAAGIFGCSISGTLSDCSNSGAINCQSEIGSLYVGDGN